MPANQGGYFNWRKRMYNDERDILVSDTQKDLNKISFIINNIPCEKDEYWKDEHRFICILDIMAKMANRFMRYAWESEKNIKDYPLQIFTNHSD
jgi:hypothetical protein